ncbi:hypothetical protein [Kitasatospora sp. NPDC058046]|uniref:hypothetical protein n=1 Tax=Kitasatospora sp. NPDC058046 TaxID=3346312 RepID=UPI0036DF1E9A
MQLAGEAVDLGEGGGEVGVGGGALTQPGGQLLVEAVGVAGIGPGIGGFCGAWVGQSGSWSVPQLVHQRSQVQACAIAARAARRG